MRTVPRTVVLTATLLVGVAVAASLSVTSSVDKSRPRLVVVANTSNGNGSGNGNVDSFDVNGVTVSGLYPGGTKTLALSVTNPYTFDIKVSDLSASLIAASRPGCAATSANLVVRPYQGPPALPLVVPKGAVQAAGVIPLFMPNTVANACQNGTFTLRLTASATKVNK